jgi:hypothetical protein
VLLHRHSDSRDSSAALTRIIFIISGEVIYHLSLTLSLNVSRWKPFDPSRNFPDLGPNFADGERIARLNNDIAYNTTHTAQEALGKVAGDKRDLDWATVLKRTFEAYIRGERPNMYGEWLQW